MNSPKFSPGKKENLTVPNFRLVFIKVLLVVLVQFPSLGFRWCDRIYQLISVLIHSLRLGMVQGALSLNDKGPISLFVQCLGFSMSSISDMASDLPGKFSSNHMGARWGKRSCWRLDPLSPLGG